MPVYGRNATSLHMVTMGIGDFAPLHPAHAGYLGISPPAIFWGGGQGRQLPS